MAPNEISELSLNDLSWLIAYCQLSSAEAVTAALTQLERLEGKLNAFITVLGGKRALGRKADEIGTAIIAARCTACR
jgi:Asp-tRNA(Asn)/Glu-tRNA(Gln) amidotransferase A subunit family amidase